VKTSMRVAPASSAFSTSSLTTLAGRSTTSPAAMRLTMPSESWRTGIFCPSGESGAGGNRVYTAAEPGETPKSSVGDGPFLLYSPPRLRGFLACRGGNHARDRSWFNHPRDHGADGDRCPRRQQ